MISADQIEHSLSVLDQLHAAERKCLLHRLAEMGVFAERDFARDLEVVRRMTAEQDRHCAWLVEAAIASGGSLGPACADVRSANLHYCDLNVLLPRVIECKEQLVRLYGESMKDRPNLTDAAAEAVARIYNRHCVHLEQLQAIQARLAQTDSK